MWEWSVVRAGTAEGLIKSFMCNGSFPKLCVYNQLNTHEAPGSSFCAAVYSGLINLFSSGRTVRPTSTPDTGNTLSFRPPSATCWGRSPTSSVGFSHSHNKPIKFMLHFIFIQSSFLKGQKENLLFIWLWPKSHLCLTGRVRCLGDEVLLQQTLFDAVVTAPLEAYWNALMLNDRWDLRYSAHLHFRPDLWSIKGSLHPKIHKWIKTSSCRQLELEIIFYQIEK